DDLTFVLRVSIAMQEHDRDGGNISDFKISNMARKLGFRGRDIFATHEKSPFGEFATQMPWNRRNRLRNADIIVVRLALTPELQNVAKPCCSNKCGWRDLALDQRICRDRGTVAKIADISGLGRRQS